MEIPKQLRLTELPHCLEQHLHSSLNVDSSSWFLHVAYDYVVVSLMQKSTMQAIERETRIPTSQKTFDLQCVLPAKMC